MNAASMSESAMLSQLIRDLGDYPSVHKPDTMIFNLLKAQAWQISHAIFAENGRQEGGFGEFGRITLPYFKMGNIDSVDLWGLNELIIFAFYLKNRARYKKVLDLGANIGLHSILMARLGWTVRSYEPDLSHFRQLCINQHLNELVNADVCAYRKAVWTENGTKSFTRVLGNTTGSHLTGMKAAPYGGLERFDVETVKFADILDGIDFIKMDVEGAEADLITSLPRTWWRNLDCLLEIGSPEAASRIWDYFEDEDQVYLFSQKIGWKIAKKLEDLPSHHSHGSLFISRDAPWGVEFL